MILGTALRSVKNTTNLVGAPSFAQVNPYGLYKHFKSDSYASHYPNVRPITNELMGIVPYAINANGKPVPHPALDALFHPNKRDSLPMFMEKLGVSVLAQDYTYILVWRNDGGQAKPGGEFGFKGKNIAGYTFLECPGIEYRDGKIYYKIGAQEFSEDEVIAIPGGAKPGNLYGGYSPYMAAAKWATLDGYIADFQNGFFENNAIPAGVFKVVASTPTEYKDMVEKLQDRHRGAGNNNNVSYAHVPMDAQGKPQQAQIEWVPFSQSNKDIDFEPLLKHVDNRLSENYGVSSIIKAVDSAAKYSNAEVSENGFAKRSVKPIAVRIYSQITHELNRITGGLGVAITFKYEIPAVSDAELVKAKTKREEVAMVKELIEMGYSLDSAVDALQLPQSYKLLKTGTGTAVIDNDKPEVDEGGEVDGAPDPSKIDGITPLSVVKVTREKLKAVSPDPSVDDSLIPYELDIEDSLNTQIDKQVESAQADISDSTEEEDDDSLADEIAATLLLLLFMRGDLVYGDGVDMALTAGLVTTGTSKFAGSLDDVDEAYLRDVVRGFNSDTKTALNKAIAKYKADGLSTDEIKEKLSDFRSEQAYRVERFSKNEAWRVSEAAGLKAMSQLDTELKNTKVTNADGDSVNQKAGTYKTWNIQPSACPLCIEYAGISVKVDEKFFGKVDAPPLHVTCRCKLSYSVIKEEDVSDKASHSELHCSHCDRFLGTTDKEKVTDKLKCSNSKCRVLDVPSVKRGEVEDE